MSELEKKELSDEELENANGGVFVPSLGLALGIKPTVDSMKQATVATPDNKPQIQNTMLFFGADNPLSNDNTPKKL